MSFLTTPSPAGSDLTGTTLAPNIVNSSLTSVGTLGSLTVTAPISGSVTGNAATATLAAEATVLDTPRTINGVSFDGSANITVAASADTLTGTTLAANVVDSSLTSVGTLAALTVTAPITGSVTGSSGSTTGNAATATALATPRAINGVNFDGTAAITVAAAAGTLTGATLAAGITASSLTSVGTLSSLTLSGAATGVTDLTTTGNTILGNASTDTLNVGNGGIIKDASGNVGIGVTPAFPFHLKGADPISAIETTGDVTTTGLTYFRFKDVNGNTGYLGFAGTANGFEISNQKSSGYVAIFTGGGAERMRIDASGNTISSVPATAPSLTANLTMVVNLTSDTNLRFSVRGSDGVTRTANLLLV